MSQEDVLVMEYSTLDNSDQIEADIKAMFKTVDDVKILDFIIATATAMISALKQSKDMTKAVRWHQRKLVKKINHNVVGMEAHYKIRIEEKVMVLKEKKTLVLIGYKVLARMDYLKIIYIIRSR